MEIVDLQYHLLSSGYIHGLLMLMEFNECRLLFMIKFMADQLLSANTEFPGSITTLWRECLILAQKQCGFPRKGPGRGDISNIQHDINVGGPFSISRMDQKDVAITATN